LIIRSQKINKRGEGPFAIFFIIGVFLLGWAFFLGNFMSEWGQQAVAINNLDGLAALILLNLNLLTGFCLLLAALAYMIFGVQS